MYCRLFPIIFTVAYAVAAPSPSLDQQFQQTVRPFLAKHCLGCHSGQNPAAQFDLKGYTSLEMVTRDYPRWALVMERLEAKDMPPKPMSPPPAEASHQVMQWIQAVRTAEIRKSAGDPGLVSHREARSGRVLLPLCLHRRRAAGGQGGRLRGARCFPRFAPDV